MRAVWIAPLALLVVSALPAVGVAQVVVGTPQQEEVVVAPPVAAPVPMVAPPLGVVTFESTGEPLTIGLLPVGAMMGYAAMPQLGCHTPCALNVPAGTYTMMATPDGGGPRLTRAVMVTPGRLDLRVTPRRSRGLAIGLTAAGGGVAVFGIAFVAVGLEFSLISSPFTTFNSTPFYLIGGIAVGAGVAVLIPGVLMLRGGSGGVEERRASTRHVRFLGLGAAPVPGGGMVVGSTFSF